MGFTSTNKYINSTGGGGSGSVTITTPVGVTGTVSISNVVTVTGVVSVSNSVGVNQGAASSVAWPVFTSQAVSGVMSVSGAVSGVVSVSGAVSGVMSVSGPVSGVMSVSGPVSVNQGAASSVAWPVFTSQAVSGVMSVSGAVSGVMSVSGAVSGVMSISGIVSALVTGFVSISNTVQVVGPGATGAALSGNPVRIAGSDGTNTRNILADTGGRLIPSVGFVSTSNSRANASLAASGTFNGVFEDITQYATISILILDAGASGGVLTVNWSEDGSNTRDTDTVTVPTANGQTFKFGRAAQFFQVSYTHSGSAGNVMIQTILSTCSLIPNTHFGSDTITTGQDGQIVHAMLRGINGSSFLNLNADSLGNLLVNVTGVANTNNILSGSSAYTMFQTTALSNTVQNVKTSSGIVGGYHFQNPNDLDAYVQFFKVTAASVTLSTTVAVRTIWIPSGGAIDGPTVPLQFASGIAIAATISKSGSTACSAALLANVDNA